MAEGPARSADTPGRTIALVAAFCALAVGLGCGHETFDLLNVAGNTGVAGNAGSSRAGAGASSAPDTIGGGGNGNEQDGGAGRMVMNHGAGVGGSAGFAQGGSIGNPTGCLAGEPCINGGVIVCPPTVSFCERCEAPRDCEGNSDSPYCIAVVGRCAQCRSKDDCAIDEVCYPLTLRCAHHCQTSSECVDDQSHPICDAQLGACVACIKDSSCRPSNGHPSYCAFGSCVECDQSNDEAAGPAAAQCPVDKPYCVGLHCQSKPR